MPAEVSVLADSANERGSRLVTFKVRVARCNWSEVMTHRSFSRNASSSRAIPVKRLIQDVIDDPYIPERFGMAMKGMQPGRFVTRESDWDEYQDCVDWWLSSCDAAIDQAREGIKLGLHKQVVNRILEPYQYINAVISATDWSNFIDLRTATNDAGNPLADIPIYNLAVSVRDLLDSSTPTQLNDGDWHVPFSGGVDDLIPEVQRQVAVARCARVSYVSHDFETVLDKGWEKDLALYHQLADSQHLSPFEHVAEARQGRYGNFNGFRQLRWELETN